MNSSYLPQLVQSKIKVDYDKQILPDTTLDEKNKQTDLFSMKILSLIFTSSRHPRNVRKQSLVRISFKTFAIASERFSYVFK
jgi:hypothetical protein